MVSVTMYSSVRLWVFQCFPRGGKYPDCILQRRKQSKRSHYPKEHGKAGSRIQASKCLFLSAVLPCCATMELFHWKHISPGAGFYDCSPAEMAASRTGQLFHLAVCTKALLQHILFFIPLRNCNIYFILPSQAKWNGGISVPSSNTTIF